MVRMPDGKDERCAPCPFCGEICDLYLGGGGAEGHWVHCGICNTDGPYADSIPQALANWDNRYVPAPKDFEGYHSAQLRLELAEAALIEARRAMLWRTPRKCYQRMVVSDGDEHRSMG